MLSSEAVILGHAGRDHQTNTTSDCDHPTNMEFQYSNSKSPLVVSSPSVDGSSPSPVNSNMVDAEGTHFPKRISITSSTIIRPIPKRISAKFYDEAHRKGLTLHETNQAAMMAHDWHRKWTQQDETNHTMPEQDFYASSGMPVSYAYDANKIEIDTDSNSAVDADADGLLICLEREEGAKNPSLGSSPEELGIVRPAPSTAHRVSQKRQHSSNTEQQNINSTLIVQSITKLKDFSEMDEKKRRNSSTEASTETDTTSDEDPSNHQAKRQFTGVNNNPTVIEDDDDSESDDFSYESYDENGGVPRLDKALSTIQRPLAVRPIAIKAIKPIALHPNRPGFGLPPPPPNEKLSPFLHSGRHGRIPRDITTTIFSGKQIVSPMSDSQLTGSSMMSHRSNSGYDMIGMTVLKRNREGAHLIEDDGEPAHVGRGNDMDSISTAANSIVKERDDILHTLAISDGDVDSEDFLSKVDPLEKHFLGKDLDTRSISRHLATDTSARASIPSSAVTTNSIEGMWLTLSKPNWFGNLGQNDNGDPMYTLGRMSFDMFSPTNLVCSLQGNFNHVEVVNGEDRKAMLDAVPKKLREEVECGKTILRTYHIVTAFTIEPSMASFPTAPNKDVMRPIKGIMTTYGYSLPDPNTPNRHSIWFTGGRIEPNNDASDIQLWKDFFKLHPPKHSFGEKAKLLAVKLLMGATIPEEIDPEDGSMNYVFTRPLGGHGMAYVDVVYLDESLRIVRGQRGTTFVFSRVPDM